MTASNDPEVLYKYLPYGDGARAMLRDCTIKFTSPLEFNDPFDSRVELLLEGSDKDWKRFFNRTITEYGLKKMSPAKRMMLASQLTRKAMSADLSGQSFLNYVNDFGVLCLSEVNDDLLMWSHYADSHQGICVGFRAGPEDRFFRRALPVIYSDEYPNVSLFDGSDKRFEATLLTKFSNWKYEMEWRIVEHEKGAGIHPYPAELLACVILGVNLPPESRREIVQLLTEKKQTVPILEAKMCKRRFALDIQPTPHNQLHTTSFVAGDFGR